MPVEARNVDVPSSEGAHRGRGAAAAPSVPSGLEIPVATLLASLQSLGGSVTELRKLHPPSDKLRDEVRNGTKRKVAKELGLRNFGCPASDALALPPFANHTTLFVDAGRGMNGQGSASAGGEYLLGRFDVLAVAACADFDAVWKFNKDANKNPFWVLHAAALNIGESEHATDFSDYSNPSGHVDLAAYIEDMGRIFDNIMYAALTAHATDVVWFPFGMGAFLRNLNKLDGSFEEVDRQLSLRDALGKRFVDSVAKAASRNKAKMFKIHLCIAPSGKGDELDANAAAFLGAICEAVQERRLDARVIDILTNADALAVAQRLADQGSKTTAVLVNGANRRLIGNHWFSGGARMAIDENLHRRSWRMAAIAYVLNGGAEAVPRSPDDLALAVRRIGGTVRKIDESNSDGHSKDRILQKFKTWDTSNDGRISKDEMKAVLIKVGMTTQDAESVFETADVNKDGFVSFQEFVDWLYGHNNLPRIVFSDVTGR
eukprot:TRINITY_DN106734_c0_g1_i1.p1 TRINITY_DN106734_c0_g1~~TRINITY_DN106734_c0_g1_i1.p1  ORF type:complete len:497 (-),score=101.05 TRINITY_DN106734_c0_g1_i1:52-1515(-)